MKKLAILFVLTLCAVLAGCGQHAALQGEEASAPQESPGAGWDIMVRGASMSAFPAISQGMTISTLAVHLTAFSSAAPSPWRAVRPWRPSRPPGIHLGT